MSYSKAYLKALICANEYLGKNKSLPFHNLGFYMWLVRAARKHIFSRDFYEGGNLINGETNDKRPIGC